MSADPVTLLWPLDRLASALEQLAVRAGYDARAVESRVPDPTAEPSRAWMNALAARMGVEVEPVVPQYRELPLVLRRAWPAMLQVRVNGLPHYLVLLGTSRGQARLLGPDGSVTLVDGGAVTRLMRREKQGRAAAEVDQLLAGVPRAPARGRVRERMLLQRLGDQQLRTCWMVRPAPSARPAALLGTVPALLVKILMNHALLSLLLAGSFWMLGRAALQAHLEMGWFTGWIALLACAIPLRLLEVWWQGLFSLQLGGVLKQQLLAGILRLSPDEIRLDGAGRHFGRVIESEAVEQLALGGGLLAILSCWIWGSPARSWGRGPAAASRWSRSAPGRCWRCCWPGVTTWPSAAGRCSGSR